MSWRAVTTSVRRKLMLVILATTFAALFLVATAMAVHDAYAYEESWIDDLTTQAEIVALASAPTIAFNDPAAARENLDLLQVRPQILAGAIYTATGKQFATYTHPDVESQKFPQSPGRFGHTINGDQLVVYHPIVENSEVAGTVYLRARFELAERIQTYAAILAFAMVGSMLIALLIAHRLQETITGPILAVTSVARKVIASRDFSLRVKKTTDDEIGVLVDAFNGMLHEVGQRAQALEESNRTLAQEMIVRRSAEARLLSADRRKDEFLAMLAHELRNPLAPIAAAAEILSVAQLDETRTRQTSEIITRQVEHMTSLVNDLLDVSRVTRGMIALGKAPQDMRTLVADAVEQVRPLMTLRHHQLMVESPQQPAPVRGDEKRLVQVIANLLNNAAKYTPEGGHITVLLVIEDRDVVLTVRDNGIGMNADLLSRVFELFTQAERSSDRALGGLGLGLALVKSLVELHGGSVAARSRGNGLGSEFTVRLPRLLQEENAHPHMAGGEQLSQPPRPLRLMVVDDNKDAADTLGRFLEAAGHQVHVVYHPRDALQRVRAVQPQACLLDIGLPDIDGHELARRLRAIPEAANAVLIAVTGYGQQHDREMAFAAGFDHHFVKPIDIARLRALLAEIGER